MIKNITICTFLYLITLILENQIKGSLDLQGSTNAFASLGYINIIMSVHYKIKKMSTSLVY